MLELLAPAGNLDAVIAAVQNGADAVYMGFGDGFNARRSADNFTRESFAKAVRYCHIRGCKVYVTLNTLVGDREMDAAAALKRKVLSIRRNDVQLKPGEHFDAEIIGMNVYNYFPHTYIGTVVDVLSYPAHKLYKVKGEEKTYLIPAVKDIFITNVDEEAREISVHMIEGLETDED